jgi:RNA polymerase sigma-70 factor (ECF subfamily)
MNDHVDPSNDEQLVVRCQQGDRDAFALLVERHWNGLYGWLYRLTRSPHMAEDLTQETLLKAWCGLPSYRVAAGFRAWLFRVARNAWIDQCRRERLTAKQDLTETAVASEPAALELVLENERATRLELAIAELPDEFREALLLRCQQSLPFAEIGEIVGTKEDTARWRVYKARQLLLQKLAATECREERSR